MLDFINGVINSPILNVIVKPFVDLWDDAKSIFRKEYSIRCWIHLVFTLAIIIVGIIMPFAISPAFGTWLGKIGDNLGVPAILNELFIGYAGGWIFGYPGSFICKQAIRIASLCIYGDADYVNFEIYCRPAAQELSLFSETPIRTEEIKKMLDYCVMQIRAAEENDPSNKSSATWYIECRRKILHGRIDAWLELKDDLDKFKKELLQHSKACNIAKQYFNKVKLMKQQTTTSESCVVQINHTSSDAGDEQELGSNAPINVSNQPSVTVNHEASKNERETANKYILHAKQRFLPIKKRQISSATNQATTNSTEPVAELSYNPELDEKTLTEMEKFLEKKKQKAECRIAKLP